MRKSPEYIATTTVAGSYLFLKSDHVALGISECVVQYVHLGLLFLEGGP